MQAYCICPSRRRNCARCAASAKSPLYFSPSYRLIAAGSHATGQSPKCEDRIRSRSTIRAQRLRRTRRARHVRVSGRAASAIRCVATTVSRLAGRPDTGSRRVSGEPISGVQGQGIRRLGNRTVPGNAVGMTAHVQRSSLRTLDPSGEAADRAASWFTADRPDPRSRHISCGLRLPSKKSADSYLHFNIGVDV